MFKIKFPTKRIFRIFPILRISGMAPFFNLFMERPSYFIIIHTEHSLILLLIIIQWFQCYTVLVAVAHFRSAP